MLELKVHIINGFLICVFLNCVVAMLLLVTMKAGILFLICSLVCASAFAETVYKTVDEEGNVFFSDKPSAGAEEITVKEAQTINIPEAKPFITKSVKEKETDRIYTKLELISPEDDTTIHDNEGKLNVQLMLEPELDEKDLIVIFVDGKAVMSGKESQYLLTNIDRGTHTIALVVQNENDKVLLRSNEVKVHLRKASRLFPNSPLKAE